VQVTALGERDETLSKRKKALVLGLGGLIGLVREQCYRKVSEQQAFVRRAASEAGSLCWGRHYVSP
jgi:hypothetical protein